MFELVYVFNKNDLFIFYPSVDSVYRLLRKYVLEDYPDMTTDELEIYLDDNEDDVFYDNIDRIQEHFCEAAYAAYDEYSDFTSDPYSYYGLNRKDFSQEIVMECCNCGRLIQATDPLWISADRYICTDCGEDIISITEDGSHYYSTVADDFEIFKLFRNYYEYQIKVQAAALIYTCASSGSEDVSKEKFALEILRRILLYTEGSFDRADIVCLI